MSEVYKIRRAGANFDISVPDNLQEIFADGASNIAVGYPNSRITFHTVQPPRPNQSVASGDPEQRKAVIELILPTAALFELCSNIAQGAIQAQDQLSAATQIVTQKFLDTLTQLSGKK